MKKSDIAGRVADRDGLSRSAAGNAVDAVFEAVGEALANGEEVRIAGFGTFGTRNRLARTGRNPAPSPGGAHGQGRQAGIRPGPSACGDLRSRGENGAVKDALRLGAIGYDAVKHLVLCRIERRPPKLDLDIYPYLPRANVATTAAASYMSLLGGGAS